jgi:hypothetical protein
LSRSDVSTVFLTDILTCRRPDDRPKQSQRGNTILIDLGINNPMRYGS